MIHNRKFELIQTKENNITISINKILLHSKYYPSKEAVKFLDNNEHIYTNKKIVVVYGIGFGYHIKELLHRIDENCKVYAFDADIEMVNKAKELGLLKEIENHSRIKLFYNYSREFINNFSDKLNLVEDLLIYKPSFKTLPKEYEDFRAVLNNYEIAKLGLERYGRIAEENYEANLKLNCRGIKEFFQYCHIEDKPVIIAAAGPSLEKDIEVLRRYQSKVKIFAVGRVLKILMDNNIKPHMLTIIDPQELVYNQIKGYEDLDIPLCFLSTASRWAVARYNGSKYIFYNNENADNIIINTGKTVAAAALDIGVKGGASKVIFVGQDLAYISDKHHAGEGALNSGYSYNKKVLGVTGEMLCTNSGFLNFKRNIENIIIDNPCIEFINCSGGARIKGTKEMDLEKALQLSLS
jgi:hypothetical protein